jgi:hypothetical protein
MTPCTECLNDFLMTLDLLPRLSACLQASQLLTPLFVCIPVYLPSCLCSCTPTYVYSCIHVRLPAVLSACLPACPSAGLVTYITLGQDYVSVCSSNFASSNLRVMYTALPLSILKRTWPSKDSISPPPPAQTHLCTTTYMHL